MQVMTYVVVLIYHARLFTTGIIKGSMATLLSTLQQNLILGPNGHPLYHPLPSPSSPPPTLASTASITPPLSALHVISHKDFAEMTDEEVHSIFCTQSIVAHSIPSLGKKKAFDLRALRMVGDVETPRMVQGNISTFLVLINAQ